MIAGGDNMAMYHITRTVMFDHIVEADSESEAEQIARCMDYDDYDDSSDIHVMAYEAEDDEF